jgi:hypothetical protein
MKADENEGGPQFVGANHVKCKRQGFRTSQEAAAVTPCLPANYLALGLQLPLARPLTPLQCSPCSDSTVCTVTRCRLVP